MTKLYSLESSGEKEPELLIDKVIRQADKNKEGLQVTASLIRQRQLLRQEIDTELKKKAETTEQGGGENDDEGDEGGEREGGGEDSEEGQAGTPKGEEGSTETESGEETEGEGEEESKTQEKEEGEAEEEEEAEESAQDVDKLEALMGSGEKAAPMKDKPKGEEKVAEESYKGHSRFSVELFGAVLDKAQRYTLALEEYNLSPKAQKPDEQPVAYVKEEVVASLQKMVSLAQRYVVKNETQVSNTKTALLKISESLTVYSACHENEKLHLNMKAVEEDDVLKAVSVPGSSDLRDTSSLLSRYFDSNTTLVSKVLENDLSSFESTLSACDYKESGGQYVYHKTLPGFVSAIATCVPYQSYLKTKYSDYQAYHGRAFKTEELYRLNAISLDKDSDLKFMLDKLSSLVVHTAVMADNLKEVSDQYNILIEKVKALCFDIEQDKVKQLADLAIDSHLKDFIRFKIASELYCSALGLSISYMTSVLTVFSVVIELDD